MRKIIAIIIFLIACIFFSKGFIEYKYILSNDSKNKSLSNLVSSFKFEDPIDRKIDFEKLIAINEDIKAWIYIPDTNVDYPIFVGSEDEEYLYKDIDGKYNPLGSIFCYRNTSFLDGNTSIFGHNGIKGKMFDILERYIDVDFLKKHENFYIYTRNKSMKCRIFSVFITDENDSIFDKQYQTGTVEFISFFEQLINRNINESINLENINISNPQTQIFNLITCYGTGSTTKRIVVNGLVLEENLYN